METGWIKINRGIAEHWIFQDAEKFRWWFDLLLMAQWEDKKVLHDSHLFVLKRGQMIASTSYLAERWGKSRPTIIKFLDLLRQDGMIERKTLYRQTPIITICNYEKYQQRADTIVDTIVDTQIDTIVDTNKEFKEIKNKKNTPKGVQKKIFVPPSVEEVAAYCRERNNNIDPERFVAFYESKGWMIGKNKMQKWKQAVITWEKSEPKKQQPQKPITIHDENSYRNNEADRARDERLQESAGIVADLLRNLRPAASD